MRLMIALIALLIPSAEAADWSRTSGPEGGTVITVARGANATLALTSPGVVHRFDGSSWVQISMLPAGTQTRIMAVGDAFLAVTQSGIFRSMDNGATWLQQFPLAGFGPAAMTTDRGTAYVSVSDTIFRSSDHGETWIKAGYRTNATGSIAAAGDTILIGSSVGFGLHRSTDGGGTFSQVTTGLPGSSGIINSIAGAGGTFYASLGHDGVYRSTDGGFSWEEQRAGLPQYDVNAYHQTTKILVVGMTPYTLTNYSIYRHDGSSWVLLPLHFMVFDFDGDGSSIIGGTIAGTWHSTDGGTNWSESNTGMIATTAKMFARIGDETFALISGRVARTTDNGNTWIYPGRINATRLISHGNSLFASTGSGVYRSTDGASTWSPVNQGITQYLPDLRDISASSDALYASFYHILSFHGNSSWFSGGVFRSTNSGESWTAVNTGLPTNGFSVVAPTHRVAPHGQSVFAATVAGVFRSMNGGGSWTSAGAGIPPNTWVETFHHSSPTILFGSNRGIFRFNGTAWEEMNNGLPQSNGYYPYAYRFVEENGTLFAATSAGVFRHDGTAWTSLGAGEPATSTVLDIAAVNNQLLAAVSARGVWRTTLPTVGVEEPAGSPDEFMLAQNYPNPFNPSTTIQFTLPVGTYNYTSLRVYDLLGREVATLVNEAKAPGNYEATWDATGQASGVYFYRLQAGEFTQTKRLLLLR
jgi:hypothetical protein